MERGVYGIAGFLSVADELRVLWSLPYLTPNMKRRCYGLGFRVYPKAWV